jgi:WG containing repeat
MNFRQHRYRTGRVRPTFILAVFILLVVAIGLSLGIRSIPRAQSIPSPTLIAQEQIVPLFAIKSNGKWGFINQTGKVIIPPQFEAAGDFQEGLAVVQVGQKYGYIDSRGKVVIQPQFVKAASFSDGLAAVYLKDNWGYINQTGKVVIPAQFPEVGPFKHGVANVAFGNKDAYINTTGKVIVKEGDFDRMPHFKEGLAAFTQGNKYGYINSDGKIIIPAQFDWAYNFQEGLAQVGNVVGTHKKYGYIDRTGKLVIGLKFDAVWDFYNGLANVKVGNLRGTINRQGAYVFTPRQIHPTFASFSEGLAAFQEKNSLWGYMDITGKTMIQPQFSQADYFKDGLAKVKTRDLWGYINRAGKMVVKPQFNEGDYVANYSNGLIRISKGRLGSNGIFEWDVSYLDRNGKPVWPPGK